MYCNNCGSSIPNNANYCQKCGSKIQSDNYIEDTNPHSLHELTNQNKSKTTNFEISTNQTQQKPIPFEIKIFPVFQIIWWIASGLIWLYEVYSVWYYFDGSMALLSFFMPPITYLVFPIYLGTIFNYWTLFWWSYLLLGLEIYLVIKNYMYEDYTP